eukprot:1206142-Alexandrium_andersonii.AAC.1
MPTEVAGLAELFDQCLVTSFSQLRKDTLGIQFGLKRVWGGFKNGLGVPGFVSLGIPGFGSWSEFGVRWVFRRISKFGFGLWRVRNG